LDVYVFCRLGIFDVVLSVESILTTNPLPSTITETAASSADPSADFASVASTTSALITASSVAVLPRTVDFLPESTVFSDWIAINIEAIAWLNVLLLLKRDNLFFSSSVHSLHPSYSLKTHCISIADQQSQFPALSLTEKALYWSAAIYRLTSLTVIEKKKEVNIAEPLLRQSLKMETITVSVFLVCLFLLI
jgi:hypothetical protein